MQIYGILLNTHLKSSCLLFILKEGEVLEKVGMRTYKNASHRKPEGKH